MGTFRYGLNEIELHLIALAHDPVAVYVPAIVKLKLTPRIVAIWASWPDPLTIIRYASDTDTIANSAYGKDGDFGHLLFL